VLRRNLCVVSCVHVANCAATALRQIPQPGEDITGASLNDPIVFTDRVKPADHIGPALAPWRRFLQTCPDGGIFSRVIFSLGFPIC